MRRIISSSRPRLFSSTVRTSSNGGSGIVTGRADSAMTQRFIAMSNLPLFHKFERSNLYINPIIHGPPAFPYLSDEDHEYMDLLTKRAVLKNRSNCLVVYQHQPVSNLSLQVQKNTTKPTGSYYFRGIRSLLQTEPTLTRQQLVTMAHLGLPTADPTEIYRRLHEACQLTQLEYIDFVYFEVNDDILDNHQKAVTETIATLYKLVQEEKIQSYGIQAVIAPYCFHNPPLKGSGESMTFPTSMEDEIMHSDHSCDMVMYPISPTIALPSTYPMLDPNRDVYEEKGEKCITAIPLIDISHL